MSVRLLVSFSIAVCFVFHAERPRAQQQPPPSPSPQQQQKPDPAASPGEKKPAPSKIANPYASTYQPLPSQTTVIRNATILTAAGPIIERGSLLLQNGKVAAVGQDVNAPAGAVVVDATGKWVTPGVIDTHSHLGVYSAPGIESLQDGNEMTNPVTADVWADHSIWPQDPQFELALAGGITAMQILPGSGNLIGGRGVTLKNVPARTAEAMKFPGAPAGLKMACGENPRRVYGQRNQTPATRMGNIAVFRRTWQSAADYRDKWKKWRDEGSDAAKRPDRNLQMETLAGVLDGEILVHNHCYRADEMATMIQLGKEFGFKISSFHHAVEAYKVRDLLAANNVCASMWSDWWGFKLEAYDGIRENIALVDEAKGCAIVHSDDAGLIQRLNQEAAKAMRAGLDAGMKITRADAVRWLTINPARALGIDKVTGSLEVGKNADVVVWSGDPFSVYARAERVFVDGALLYDRGSKTRQPSSDFVTGLHHVAGHQFTARAVGVTDASDPRGYDVQRRPRVEAVAAAQRNGGGLERASDDGRSCSGDHQRPDPYGLRTGDRARNHRSQRRQDRGGRRRRAGARGRESDRRRRQDRHARLDRILHQHRHRRDLGIGGGDRRPEHHRQGVERRVQRAGLVQPGFHGDPGDARRWHHAGDGGARRHRQRHRGTRRGIRPGRRTGAAERDESAGGDVRRARRSRRQPGRRIARVGGSPPSRGAPGRDRLQSAPGGVERCPAPQLRARTAGSRGAPSRHPRRDSPRGPGATAPATCSRRFAWPRSST